MRQKPMISLSANKNFLKRHNDSLYKVVNDAKKVKKLTVLT